MEEPQVTIEMPWARNQSGHRKTMRLSKTPRGTIKRLAYALRRG
jgi:hypothetical protein